MKEWNFQVKSSPKEVSKKLDSSLGARNLFVLNLSYGKQDSVKFKLRKRVLLAFELISQNNIIVNGKIIKTEAENQTDVKIFFTLHPLSKLLLYSHFVLGLLFLAAMTLQINSSSYNLIIGGLLLIIGVLYKLHLQKVFNKHVQEYKTLISEVLSLKKNRQQVTIAK